MDGHLNVPAVSLASGVAGLSYLGEDRWRLRPDPTQVLVFDRAEDGEVIGYHIRDQLPVLYALADNYVNFDQWY